jgi:predicted permease
MNTPRLARVLLRLAARRGEAADLVGDLEEAHRSRTARRGSTLAALLTCLEALDITTALLRRRMLSGLGSWGSRVRVIHWLDVKLGVRMLAKYPGLSIVAAIGMAVAIAIGAVAFSLIASMMDPALPLPEGERVVALRNAIITEPGRNRASLRDFLAWRDALESVRDLAAFTTVHRNLIVPGEGVELVRLVRMTASGFRMARAAPVLGRPLIEDDERHDARVVVIGFEEWQQRFAADPSIIGRLIGLGSDVYTIVGVMPEGFRFPVDDRYWIPLVIAPADQERADAISLTIAGRLAEGATLERAQAELSAIGTRMAAAHPDTHGHLRPRVLSYPRAFYDIDSPEIVWTLHSFRLFLSLLLVVVAVNVAILVYARNATRLGEIAVRTALGASRARVVTQLFVEALVLSVTAALVGLAIAGIALAKLQQLAEQELVGRRLGDLPFWVDLGLSPPVITYALVLAVVGAVIVGVVPALKATGRHVQTMLHQLAGRGAPMQLGRAWTALIIVQVAVAVAVLPFALHLTQEVIRTTPGAGYPAEEFLETSLAIERADVPQDTSAASQRAIEQRFRARASELIGQLESDPAVAGLTIRSGVSSDRIQVGDIPSSGRDPRPISGSSPRIDRVEPDFFALYGMPILAGRAFVDADARAGARAVIVNHVFAEQALGGSAAVGRHLRLVPESDNAGEVETSPWLEVVGVVRDFADYESKWVYLPTDVGQLSPPIKLAIRVRVDPAMSFAPRLRELAAAVDPGLQLDGLACAAELHEQGQQFLRYVAIGTTAVTLSVLLLSAAGIHAMMSFTVALRRREIGIRSALGAGARRLLTGIFTRASAQLLAGILFGVIGAVALDRLAGKGPVRDGNSVVLLMTAVLMTTVGLLAAIGPARRGLAVQPTEALREE